MSRDGLARLQAEVQASILGHGAAGQEHVLGDRRASPEQRLRVYQDAYRLRLVRVLAEDFDGLRAMAGEREFEALATAYLQAHPSRQPSVRWLGHVLARFLSGTAPWSERPALAEMAAFEWAWGRAFDAADAPAADAAALAGIGPERWAALGLRLHPSLQRLVLEWNVPACFRSVTRGERLPIPERGAPTTWLLWRRELSVHWRSLDPDEAHALARFAAGAQFGEVCEALLRWHAAGDVPARAAEMLQRWLTDGLVTAVQV